MNLTKLNVSTMSCEHCEKTIKAALLSISGVSDVKVDLSSKIVTVSHKDSVPAEFLRNTIEEEGYDVMICV